jgi:hypothetical protein
VEIFKSDSSQPIKDTITILQTGGTALVAGVEVTTIDNAETLLPLDGDVLAFLKRKGDYYYSAYGDGGLMVVTPSGDVKTGYDLKNVLEFRGKQSKAVEEIVSTLRSLRDHKGVN